MKSWHKIRLLIALLLLFFVAVVAMKVGFGFWGGPFWSKDSVNEVNILEVPTISYVVVPFLTREDISVVVKSYSEVGDLDSVADFYARFVGNFDDTYLILSASIVYEIPPNLLFALVFAESSFSSSAVNGHLNKDGSTDYGWLQLNSGVFKAYTKEDLLDKHINLRLGCQHLLQFYKKYGTWDEAIMYYNGFSTKSVKHQARVLEKERELDKAFHMSGIRSNALGSHSE